MIWAAMSSAGVGPLCFLKATVNAAIYQEMLDPYQNATDTAPSSVPWSSPVPLFFGAG